MRTVRGVSLAFGLILSTAVMAETSVVSKPGAGKKNVHYVSNRAPLMKSALIKLPVGAVKPEGWLKECMIRQKNGLSGHLGEISAWLQKKDNAWLNKDGRGKWGWEELPYWLKGYANTAYILNDKDALKETTVWIEGTIRSQRDNGDFGPFHTDPRNGSRDFWGNMIMLYCLQSHYEYSKDKRILDLMTRYFKFQLSVPDGKFLSGYWQKVRGGDNLHSVMWLYNRTGDKFLLKLMEKIHRNTSKWMSRGHSRREIKSHPAIRHGLNWPAWFLDQIDWHNVNHAQCFREPAQYYLLSKNKDHLAAAYENFEIVRKHFGQVPGGMFGGDEICRPGYDDPRQAIETCGIVEQMNSDQHMLRITADPFWADHCEEIAFNMYPASLTADFKAIRYLTAPNMVVSDAVNHSPGICNPGPFLPMNPFSSRCCQHNHAQGWPYLTENLWMATPDNGLCAAIYAASNVKAVVGDGVEISISEKTRYPFEDNILFTINTPRKVQFPLYVRIPVWCKKARLLINGHAEAVKPAPSHYVKIDRTWGDGDTVSLELPMELAVKTYAKNHNSMSVHYGPLLFSLKIKEKYTKRDSTKGAIHDSRWQKTVDPKEWPTWEIHPTSAWNYGLDLEMGRNKSFRIKRKAWPAGNFPFTTEDAPIAVIAKGRQIPQWQLDVHGLCAELQDSPVRTDAPVEEIELIPAGAARLRICAFPVVGNGPDAIEWKGPKPYNPKTSHTNSSDSVIAMCDGITPKSSSDISIPRQTFWPHKGTDEYLQYTFNKAINVSSVSVYWFDDSPRGGCRIPQKWELFYRAGGVWKKADVAAGYGTAKNKYNVVALTKPVLTKGLKIKLKLQDNYSGGVLEWRVNK